MSRNLVPGALGCVYLGSTKDVELQCYGMQLQAAESRAWSWHSTTERHLVKDLIPQP